MHRRRARRPFDVALVCVVSLLAAVACGPIDGVMSADLDGRTYFPSCTTGIPIGRLGDSIDGVDVLVPTWAETDERQIADLPVEEAFAVRFPDGVCVRRGRWVLFVNEDLSNARIEELIAMFPHRSGGSPHGENTPVPSPVASTPQQR